MLPVRVLLVDDSPEFLRAASLFLATDPLVTIAGAALSGQDALHQVEQVHPDLVLMDLAMPGMGGLETTQRIKMQPGAPCVIIVTLHDNAEYRAAARDVGADGFVAKSAFGPQLQSMIQSLFPECRIQAETEAQGGTSGNEPVPWLDGAPDKSIEEHTRDRSRRDQKVVCDEAGTASTPQGS